MTTKTSAYEWSGYIKILSVVILLIGVAEIFYTFFMDNGLRIGWSSLVVGIFCICCGLSGLRAGYAKHVAVARQYYRFLVLTAIVLALMEIVYLALTNIFVDDYYNDCSWSPSSCDYNSDTLKLMLLISGLISLGLVFVCCTCCIACARSYVNALEREDYPEGYTTITTMSPGYQHVPGYPAQPAYPQPAYNHTPAYTTPLYPQAPSYQTYPNGYQPNAYQPNAYQPNAYQPNTYTYQPNASNRV